jgi:hypothetical protein
MRNGIVFLILFLGISETLLNSFISSNCVQDHITSRDNFFLYNLYKFYFFLLFLWLVLLLLCWIEVVTVDTPVLFLIIEEKLYGIHCIEVYSFTLNLLRVCIRKVCWIFFFFGMLFLHLLRWSCIFKMIIYYCGTSHLFVYAESSMHSRDKSHLFMMNTFLTCY